MGTCPDSIKRLIERFDQQLDQVRSPDYNETQLRIDFVNPLFAALGWDIDNRLGNAEQYREVVHEDKVKVAGQTKAPDYSFRIGGARKFFLEAKKPFVNLKTAWEPAYQLRRYGWSAKLAVSILTDFEELAIYDCRIAPKQFDKPSVARREYIGYREYCDRWDFLEGTFSNRAVRQGDFDRYCGTTRGRGRQEFDDTFLEEIEEWRKLLASNLALRNESLDESSLNFSVQRIIDRIIFLRIAEDRGTETVGQLRGLLNGDSTYARLGKLFRDADARYNSGLFHFEKEKGRDEQPDTLTPGLEIDDATLKKIIKRLYYPESPYEFTVVTADILGSVYERFLGKVITLTDGHRAKIEEKPEVRKAGGVYYTPTYIVDYIVKNTVGKLLEGKTPKESAKLKVLDPACGSGSFLIGAYQFLLDWHLTEYTKGDPQKLATGKSAVLRPGPSSPSPGTPGEGRGEGLAAARAENSWKLTIAERKRILLDNIHGVDLDASAVEVTKLNLLLKCLEGETSQTLGFQQRLFRERALPDLGRNILCGNSLIGTDVMATEAWKEMNEEERQKINPLDYETAFPRANKHGGFDVVIGNPPYIRVSNLDEAVRPLLYAAYDLNHRFDIYVAFIEKGMRLLNDDGRLGFILPNKFFTTDYGSPVRQLLSEKRAIESVVDFGDQQVFEGATTYTALLFLWKRPTDIIEYFKGKLVPEKSGFTSDISLKVSASGLTGAPWTFVGAPALEILNRARNHPTLASLYDVQHGLQTGLDAFFLLQALSSSGGISTVKSELEDRAFEIEDAAIRPVVKGLVDLQRYIVRGTSRRVFFPYSSSTAGVMPSPQGWLEAQYPLAWKYVLRHRAELVARGATTWYAFRRRNYDLRDDLPRLLVPSIGTRASFAYDPSGTTHFVGSGGGGGGGYGLNRKPATRIDDRYTLGLLNSRLVDWMAKQSNSRFGHGYYSYNRQFIDPLCVAIADDNDQDQIIQMVDAMLALHKRLTTEMVPQRQEQIQRQIDATDRQIDQLVYQLYGLTDDEVRIVEQVTG